MAYRSYDNSKWYNERGLVIVEREAFSERVRQALLAGERALQFAGGAQERGRVSFEEISETVEEAGEKSET